MGKKTIRTLLKRVGLISLDVAIVTLFSLAFIIKYRIRSVIKEVVRQETKGVYQLDFSKISIDFIKGTVKLHAVDLKPTDTHADNKDYRLTINQLYFSLASWNQLLFHRKLFLDSLRLDLPHITIFQRLAQKNNNGLTPIQEIFRSLKNISETFKVRMLQINNGRIDLYAKANEAPIVINNIGFLIENFGQKTHPHNHLRFADNVMLTIARQNWALPSGQIIQFGNLFFSGTDQTFQVDSCSITTAPDSRGQRTSLFAEKFLFRTDELASVFEKNELNIDTLYCRSPLLSVAIPASSNTDTVNDLNESIHQLPGRINIKFINIENGQIHLTSSDGKRSYTGKKTNIKVYRLHIEHDPVTIIRTGGIDLDLHEITFASRDSLLMLTVNEFTLDSNNLVCRKAFLKPSPAFKGYLSGITLPAFTLFDISLNDLLEKRLKGQVVVFERPQFFFASGAAKKKAPENGIPINKFYSTLKDLAELIDVRWLTIKDGTLDYHSTISPAPVLAIRNIDAEINLVNMLHSASLRATKRSIHAVNIGTLNLRKDNASIDLKDFFIDGNRDIGHLRSLRVQLLSGAQLNAANLYWERFSWEEFVRDKHINVDTLNIPELDVCGQIPVNRPQENRGGLLPITINKLLIKQSQIDLKTDNNAELTAKANNISLKKLHAAGKLFSWQNLQAGLDSILFKGDNKQIAIQQMSFAAAGKSAITNMQYLDSTNRVTIPEIKFQLPLNNSSFNNLELPFLSIYRPQIIINEPQQGRRAVAKNTAAVFTPFQIRELNIIDGMFSYKRNDNPLSIYARFGVHTLAGGIESGNKNALVFDKFFLNIDSLTLVKPLANGSLTISDLRGGLTDYPLTVNFNSDNTHLKNVINSIYITGGNMLYSDSSVVASVSNISGNGTEGALAFSDVAIRPAKSLEAFLKTSIWQKDYVTFRCDSIGLQYINNLALLNDTALVIRRIYLQAPHIATFRDKNIAFQHGIEKLMPTKLIAALKMPVYIDSVQIKGASVDVHEISAVTKKEGVVQLQHLDAMFKKVVSRPSGYDSLVLDVSGRVLGYDMRAFRYAESYNDSLSGFTMHYGFSPMQLSHLTKVTQPLSAIAITNGEADTLYAKLSGNNYGAAGEMNFYYRNLKVRLLNKDDTAKKSLLLIVKTLLANGLIRSNNQKQALMFFMRDRERFIFNYWVKTIFSGFITSAGVKKNRKYEKMYKKVAKKYALPAGIKTKVLP